MHYKEIMYDCIVTKPEMEKLTRKVVEMEVQHFGSCLYSCLQVVGCHSDNILFLF